jgi:sterol 22-desaturase
MAAERFNTSMAQPELPRAWPFSTSQLHRALPSFLAGWSAWQYVATFLLGVVVYDQGNPESRVHGKLLQLLTLSLVMYIKRKGSIAGPPLKIPLMGPFLQALHPKFDAYLAQWASGPLSCVSVFHKYVL